MPRFCLLGSTMADADVVQSRAKPGGIAASSAFVALLEGAGGGASQAQEWICMPVQDSVHNGRYSKGPLWEFVGVG